jgi:hypothetical protein
MKQRGNKMKLKVLLAGAIAVLLSSCISPYRETEKEAPKPELKTTQSIIVPKDREFSPVAGETTIAKPDTTITISEIGQKFEVKTGQEVNLIYDGIDPEETYFVYESTFDGYMLELRRREDDIEITFKQMCQTFIVASPSLTNITLPKSLKWEQIVWTPRADGTWEVRIGTTERGCKSKALQELKNLRTKEYDNSIPR